MCGIVGYSGASNGVVPVIEGLSRLEYRGYDSSGISLIRDNKIEIYKREGKLERLKEFIEDKSLEGNICIGHTRWATHGEVNDNNAHPHGNEIFSIVHNGIIENATELKRELTAKGYDFHTQTDTEVFLVLLTYNFDQTKEIKQAIIETFKSVRGNSAFVVLHKESSKIFSIKRSAPLVCGLNEASQEVFVSSDPYALIGFASKIYFPENEILCVADYLNNLAPLSFFDLEGNESAAYRTQEQQLESEAISKGEFEHFMLKEIHEQPELIHKLESIYLGKQGESNLRALEEFAKKDFVHIVACGTALHAGMVIKNYIEKFSKIRVSHDFASEFRYKNPNIAAEDLGLFISQSGETADTLACQELFLEDGISNLSIVNVEGSTLFRNSDQNLLIHAGQEIGVASTKAFTQQVLVGLLFANAIGKRLNIQELKREFSILSQRVRELLHQEEHIRNIAKEIYNKTGFIFTGRGSQYPIALEGALKLKEIAYVHAEGYASGELKHGPISLIDENMVNVAIVTPDLYDKTLSNAEEVKSRRGIMVVIGEEENEDLREMADHFIGLNFEGLEETQVVLTNVVLQLLSYHIAKLKGTDIDKPRNLAKSVTVE